jgi:hypothetical protein
MAPMPTKPRQRRQCGGGGPSLPIGRRRGLGVRTCKKWKLHHGKSFVARFSFLVAHTLSRVAVASIVEKEKKTGYPPQGLQFLIASRAKSNRNSCTFPHC